MRAAKIKCTLAELPKYYRERERRFQEQLRGAMELAAYDGLEIMRNATPVATGTLRDGWEVRIRRDTIRLINGVPYWFFVEYGTRNMPPKHFIRGAQPLLRMALENRIRAVTQ